MPAIRTHGKLEETREELKAYNTGGYGVYFTINEMKNLKERKKDNVLSCRAVWIDDDGDGKGGRTDLTKIPIPPSLSIQTSPGKYQHMWYTNTANLYEWQQVMDGITSNYGGDKGAKLLTQVLRLPDFVNTKPSYDKPVVVITGGTFQSYPWEEIKKSFNFTPPLKTAVPTARPVTDIEHCAEAILGGESIYPMCEALTMSLANKRIPYKDITGIVSALVKFSAASPSRKDNALSKMPSLVQSAVAKVSRDSHSMYMPEEHSSLYTQLEYPPGRIGDIARDIVKSTPYPSPEMAIAGAFHFVSVLGAGCYHYKGTMAGRTRTLLAPQGRGKQSISNYFESLMAKLPILVEDYIMEDAHTPFNNHVDMNEHRVRSLIISEAGILNSSQSGDKQGKIAWRLRALTTTVGGAPLRVAGITKANAANTMLRDTAKPVYCAMLCLLDESTPETYLPSASKDLAEDSGALARSEVYFIGYETEFNEDHGGDIDPGVLGLFKALAIQYENSNVKDGLEESVKDRMVLVDFSQVEQKLINYQHANVSTRHCTGIERAVTVRKAEKIITSCMLMAIADSCDPRSETARTPVVTLEHFQYAVKLHNEIARCILENSKRGHMASVFDRAVEKITGHAINVVNGTDPDMVLLKETPSGEPIITLNWLGRKIRSGDSIRKELARNSYRNNKTILVDIAESAVISGVLTPYKSAQNEYLIDKGVH